MALRRGFKSEAKALSEETRKELGLTPYDPLDAFMLAAHLNIPVLGMSDQNSQIPPEVIRYFQHEGDCHFSAVTVFQGKRREIVHNDFHSPGRQTSNIVHELAHALLLHPPTPPFNGDGFRNYDSEIENEANWLAGELLIPDKAAVMIVQRGLDIAQAAKRFNVSAPMVTFRINVTGARTRSARYAGLRL